MRKVVFGSSSTFPRNLRVPQKYRDFSQKILHFPHYWKYIVTAFASCQNRESKNNFTSTMIWVWHSTSQAYYVIETASLWLTHCCSLNTVVSLSLLYCIKAPSLRGYNIEFAIIWLLIETYWRSLIEASSLKLPHWTCLLRLLLSLMLPQLLMLPLWELRPFQ